MSVCSVFGGLPVVIPLLGKPFDEATVLCITDAFE
jgi:hypothetical protein